MAAQRGMALLRSGFEPEWDSQAWRRLISDARARLQYGEVTEVTELTTVVQIVTVEQTRGCRGRGDNQEREDRNRGRQPYGETDEPSLHRTMSGFCSRPDKTQKTAQAAQAWNLALLYHAHPRVSINGNRNSRNRLATATFAPAFHLRSARSRYDEELSSPDR